MERKYIGPYTEEEAEVIFIDEVEDGNPPLFSGLQK